LEAAYIPHYDYNQRCIGVAARMPSLPTAGVIADLA
jgi:hypothetical protein